MSNDYALPRSMEEEAQDAEDQYYSDLASGEYGPVPADDHWWWSPAGQPT